MFGVWSLEFGISVTFVTVGFPSVSVPVLSKIVTLTLLAISSVSAFLIKIPCSAPLPVPTIIAVGVASPKAQGQAIISTAIMLVNAKLKAAVAGPKTYQRTKVATASIRTTGTK